MVPQLILCLSLCGGLLFGQAPSPVGVAIDSSVFDPAFRVLEAETGRDSFELYVQRGREQLLSQSAYTYYAERGVELAQSCYRYRDYQWGLDLLQQVEKDLAAAAYELPDTLEIDLQYQVARGYMYLREDEAAIGLIEATRPRLDTLTIPFEKFTNLLGYIYLRDARYPLAVEHLSLVLELRKQLYGEEHDRVASVMNNLGNAYYWLGLIPTAEQLYREGLRIRRKVLGPENYRLYGLLNNLGNVYSEKGEFFRSVLTYREAIDLLEAQDEPYDLELARVYVNLASSLSKNGGLAEAESYYRQVAALLRDQDGAEANQLLGVVQTNLANQASLRREYDQAIRLQNRGLEYYATSLDELDPLYLSARNNLGVYRNEQAAYDQALAILLPLETDLARVPEQQGLLANLYNDIGEAYAGLGQLAEAEDYQRRALRIQKEKWGQKDFRQAYTYNRLAEIALWRGQRDSALALVDRALAANSAGTLPATGYGYYEYYLESLLLKARLLLRGEAALELYRVADRVLTNIRHELPDVEDKIDFAHYSYEVAAGAVATAAELLPAGHPRAMEWAYYFSERAKANVLGQLLTLNQGKSFAGIPADSIQREEGLQTTISYYKLQLATETDSAYLARYQAALFSAQREYRQLIAEFQAHYPRYYALKYADRPPDLNTIRQAIPADRAVVSYFTTEAMLYCFVLTRTEEQLHATPIDARFANRLTGLRKTITNRLAADYVQLAQELYPTLFPFELPAGITRLTLIPDAGLSQIPFETLLTERVEPTAAPDFSALPYLIRRYEINYAPSVSIWHRQALEPDREYAGDLSAYAPVFSDPASAGTNLTTLRTPLSSNVEILRSVTEDGITVAALPGALSEIERIAEVFDRQNRRARAFLFDRASEATFKQNLDIGYRFLHIATHGFAHRTEPDLSGLLFYPDTSATEDHVLYSGELYGLSLATDLVVLSACETGLGEQILGEGVLGLSRAFLYAGARNLLVSLWKVQDRATAELMVDFYRTYWELSTADYATPLRQAKLGLIQSAEFSDPYYWSPFVLIGR